jgi:Cys-tRNA(Pro)/Cys-tRNA(Cys) deacylase
MDELHKLHKNVRDAISRSQADYKIHDHGDFSSRIETPQDFAAALGYPIQRITKTLFLRSQDRRVYAAGVCSIDNRLDFKSIAKIVGLNHIEVASAEDLGTETGYPVNGVSPLGLADNITVVIDRLLLDYPTVLVGGGAIAIEIELTPSDLMHLSRATADSITK